MLSPQQFNQKWGDKFSKWKASAMGRDFDEVLQTISPALNPPESRGDSGTALEFQGEIRSYAKLMKAIAEMEFVSVLQEEPTATFTGTGE